MHTTWPAQTARFMALIICLLSLFAVAQAMNLYSYDLDSLVYMSSDIVEGTLVRKYQEHDLHLTEIKVTAVQKGQFAPGQSVALTALDEYQVPDEAKEGPFGNAFRSLQVGDTFFFFLVRAKKTFLWEIPDDAVIYWTVPSGLKLVRDNKVYGFAQYRNPGPYVAVIPDSPEKKSPTPEEFRAQIRASIPKTDAIAAQLKQSATSEDVPKLMQLLLERAQTDGIRHRDVIAEAACTNLANLHDPEPLFAALSLERSFMCRQLLAEGLRTPAGREALLKRIGNDRESLVKRIGYAYLLTDVGGVYHQTYTNISDGRVTGTPRDNNAEYLTRIARLTRENRQHEELCLALLNSLDFLFRSTASLKEEAILGDIQTALAVLKTLYGDTTSEQVKFQLEVAINNGSRTAYGQLDSPCGPVISRITLPDPNRYSKPAERSLIFEYTIYVLDTPVDAPSIILVNQDTHKSLSIPAEIPFKSEGGYNIGGSNSVRLPDDLPHGRYRIYLQFTRGEKVVSVGHYAEATL